MVKRSAKGGNVEMEPKRKDDFGFGFVQIGITRPKQINHVEILLSFYLEIEKTYYFKDI